MRIEESIISRHGISDRIIKEIPFLKGKRLKGYLPIDFALFYFLRPSVCVLYQHNSCAKPWKHFKREHGNFQCCLFSHSYSLWLCSHLRSLDPWHRSMPTSRKHGLKMTELLRTLSNFHCHTNLKEAYRSAITLSLYLRSGVLELDSSPAESSFPCKTLIALPHIGFMSVAQTYIYRTIPSSITPEIVAVFTRFILESRKAGSKWLDEGFLWE